MGKAQSSVLLATSFSYSSDAETRLLQRFTTLMDDWDESTSAHSGLRTSVTGLSSITDVSQVPW